MFEVIFLAVRMGLYAAFAALAGAEIGSWDATAGNYSVNAGDLAQIVSYALAYAGTFLASRFAKVK